MHRIIAKLDRYFRGSWHTGILDPSIGLWRVDSTHLAYLKAENAKGRHILLQPAPENDAYYFLADDIPPVLLRQHHQYPDGSWRAGRMVIETSPSNFQVWIHSARALTLREKRYWLRRLHSDPGADPHNRWGRHPGFFNRKDNHRSTSGLYPLSKLIWVDWRGSAVIPCVTIPTASQSLLNHPFPTVTTTAIQRLDYDRGNESVTDFAFALALLRRNYPKDQVMQRIASERTDWTNHSGPNQRKDYLIRTVENAWKIIRNQHV